MQGEHGTADAHDAAEPDFRKSSFSGTNGCVEVAAAALDGAVFVRDSKNAAGPRLRFTPDEWTAFVLGVKAGEFDGM